MEQNSREPCQRLKIFNPGDKNVNPGVPESVEIFKKCVTISHCIKPVMVIVFSSTNSFIGTLVLGYGWESQEGLVI